MANKYFTISYDDGLEQDRKIIALMEKYGIRGTFNLSSGLFGKKSYIERKFLDFGFDTEKTSGKRVVEHFIMGEDEARQVYRNVEIASHGMHHLNEGKIPAENLKEEITEDKKRLEEIFERPVKGHIFPYGGKNEAVYAEMRQAGILYGREATIGKKPKDFHLHMDAHGVITPTCWHLDSFAEPLLKQFIEAPVGEQDLVFYMWGHGYELDYGTRRGNFQYLEHLFALVSAAKDVQFVTNGELVERETSAAMS